MAVIVSHANELTGATTASGAIEDGSRSLSADSSGWNKADQVAFRVLEPRRLTSTRHPGNAVLGPRLRRVVLLEHHTTAPHLVNRSAHVSHMDDRLRELP